MRNKYLWVIFCFFILLDVKGQVSGCTDPLANNYNPLATVNDGSCVYNSSSVSPTATYVLSDTLVETSGLILWNNQIWTHNDDTDINIYSLDTIDGSIIQAHPLTGTVNNDWEEISQDSNYVYMGDFGNNANGNRTDLKILRVEKNSLLNNVPIIDTIFFSYSNQTDFTAQGADHTDFDCEAMVVTSDSIFLFTKQWVSLKTSLYSLPKIPGTYVANLILTYDIQGLVTGANLLPDKRIIALCGYSTLLQPFIFLLYDFNGTDYFGANKRKIGLSLSFHQIEGIASNNGLKYYLSNEYFSQTSTPQEFHILDLSSYLGNYLGLSSGINEIKNKPGISSYPNPANNSITIETVIVPADYYITNIFGELVKKGTLLNDMSEINISDLNDGMYFLTVGDDKSYRTKLIKQ